MFIEEFETLLLKSLTGGIKREIRLLAVYSTTMMVKALKAAF
jgi:hypothetical protein